MAKYDVILGSYISDKILDSCRDGIFFQSTSSGIEKTNIKKIKEKNIIMCNSFSGAIFVAEYAFSMMMALFSKIHLANNFSLIEKDNNFSKTSILHTESVRSKKVGFFGYGHIAQNISKMLQPFDPEIYAYSNSFKEYILNSPKAKKLSKMEIIKSCDVIFVTLPLNLKTKNFIKNNDLMIANPESIWINISREEVVSTKILIKAVQNGWIKYMASEVNKNLNSTYYVELEKLLDNKRDVKNQIIISPYRAIRNNKLFPFLEEPIMNLLLYANRAELINKVI